MKLKILAVTVGVLLINSSAYAVCDGCVTGAVTAANTSITGAVTAANSSITSAVSAANTSITTAIEKNTLSTFNKINTDTDRMIAALIKHGDSINDNQTDLFNQQKIWESQKSPTICATQDGMARIAVASAKASQVEKAVGHYESKRLKGTQVVTREAISRSNAHDVKFCSDEDESLGICKAVEPVYQNLDIDSLRALSPVNGVFDEVEDQASSIFIENTYTPDPAPPLPKGFKQDSVNAKLFREIQNSYVGQTSTGLLSVNYLRSTLTNTAANGAEPSGLDMEMENYVNSLASPIKISNAKSAQNLSSEVNDMNQIAGFQTQLMWLQYKELQRQGRMLGVLVVNSAENRLKEQVNMARASAGSNKSD